MPQFVIEREVPGAGSLSEAQIRELSLHSLQTLKEMGPKIQWLHSYVTEDKVYCVYLAPDEETIREHARRTNIPANSVSGVRRLIDPKKYASWRSEVAGSFSSESRIAAGKGNAHPSAQTRFPSD